MESCDSNCLDIFQIYSQYCDIVSGAYARREEGYRLVDDLQKTNLSKDALFELSKLVESKVHLRMSIFDEVAKLMSRLELMVDFYEFSRFYDFVFFICRENGQKNITVRRAVTAWKLVLTGRFRLLIQWCDFVEKNQRHNISEDTWRQVLAFSRCVHENLEGYDPEGAWPVIIDDFVEHMYRVTGSNGNLNLFCNCGDSEAQLFEDPLPGLKTFPGLKRKVYEDFKGQEEEIFCKFSGAGDILSSKRRHIEINMEDKQIRTTTNDCTETAKHNSPRGCSKSPCAVEGCLLKGFAGLLSGHSCLRFDRERRVSYT